MTIDINNQCKKGRYTTDATKQYSRSNRSRADTYDVNKPCHVDGLTSLLCYDTRLTLRRTKHTPHRCLVDANYLLVSPAYTASVYTGTQPLPCQFVHGTQPIPRQCTRVHSLYRAQCVHGYTAYTASVCTRYTAFTRSVYTRVHSL